MNNTYELYKIRHEDKDKQYYDKYKTFINDLNNIESISFYRDVIDEDGCLVDKFFYITFKTRSRMYIDEYDYDLLTKILKERKGK